MVTCIAYGLLFLLGALGYGFIEFLWRGYTHWSMLLLGGLCFLSLYRIAQSKYTFFVQCIWGTFTITLAELVAGLLCNRLLHLGIWDYSAEWGNVYGQICPRYSMYWFLLCLPIFAILRNQKSLSDTHTINKSDS